MGNRSSKRSQDTTRDHVNVRTRPVPTRRSGGSGRGNIMMNQSSVPDNSNEVKKSTTDSNDSTDSVDSVDSKKTEYMKKNKNKIILCILLYLVLLVWAILLSMRTEDKEHRVIHTSIAILCPPTYIIAYYLNNFQ
jgi:hypothetical protein